MKTKLITLLVLAIFVNTHAQVLFEKHVISTDVSSPYGISSGDFDNDGDLDVVSLSGDLIAKVAWFENTDGLGSFENNPNIISTNIYWGNDVITSDIDGDGNLDILASFEIDRIVFYKNFGNGDFGEDTLQFITAASNTDGPRGVYSADINGDGDMDVLSASRWDNKIAWYENLGGGDFGNLQTNQRIITTNAIDAHSVYATDIDGDGDMDVLSASWDDNKIAWYENTDGEGNFGPQLIITTDAAGANEVFAEDLDGDGDMDVLSASSDDNKIAWYKNIDGEGNFGPQQILTVAAWDAHSVTAKDFDDDGDIDVIFVASFLSKISWCENLDGLGNFSDPKIITLSAMGSQHIAVEDIDEDGDLDVLSANPWAQETVWFENPRILSVNESLIVDFSVYPSPTTGILNIQSETTIVQIEIYNQLGQLILTSTNESPAGRTGNTIDISSVSQGIYLIKIMDENGSIGTQRVVKK